MRIRIVADSDPESPREWDNVGTIIHWHRRYNLGDRKLDRTEHDAVSRGGLKLLDRYLRMRKDAAIVLPVSLLDHSGLHMWIGGGPHWSDAAGWDSGTVGVIYCTRKQVQDEWGGDLARAEKYLRGEIETYDQFLRGDVYGFIVEYNDGREDSCWGFYGDDPKTNGMIDHWDRVARSWWARFGHNVQPEY